MNDYQGIRIRYGDLRSDLERMRDLANPFLARECDGVITACIEQVDNIRNGKCGVVHPLEIAEGWPIKTIDSAGEYRNSGKDGGRPVFGRVWFRWGLLNVDRGKRRQDYFHLSGEVTTSIEITDYENDERVARWQFEAGDGSSPGCHFHAAMNQYGDQGLFPEWLKVPRLPSILLSPMDGLEFLLGELFQRRWLEEVSADSEVRNSWANSQSHRMERMLRWSLERIRNPDTTPWTDLKKAKPPFDLLTES